MLSTNQTTSIDKVSFPRAAEVTTTNLGDRLFLRAAFRSAWAFDQDEP